MTPGETRRRRVRSEREGGGGKERKVLKKGGKTLEERVKEGGPGKGL